MDQVKQAPQSPISGRAHRFLPASILTVVLLLVLPWPGLPYARLDWVASSQPYETLTIDVDPLFPTANNDIIITLSGIWPNTCIPEYVEHRVEDRDIFITGMGGPGPETFCAQALAPWSFSTNIGQLPAGRYSVHAQVSSIDGSIVMEQSTAFEVAAEPTSFPKGTGYLSARVYIDQRCNGSFDSGDVPLADIPITLAFPSGERGTQRTTSFGMVSFAGFDPSNGISVSAQVPDSHRRRVLSPCPHNARVIELGPRDFEPGYIYHKYLQFRVYVVGFSDAR